jgi:ribose 5-phosphate isomerase B|tara:strand:- start:3890 stop:4333 length:444 start_codon:yes stop_codon:yes gene_type:complete
LRIIIGSDHAGYKLKEHLKTYLVELGHEMRDVGAYDEQPVDYPDEAVEVAQGVANGNCDRGMLICGTGIGMSIAANKVPGVRAALVTDTMTAQLSRAHNDANVLCLGGWLVGEKLGEEIAKSWLDTMYDRGKHANRLRKITNIEGRG